MPTLKALICSNNLHVTSTFIRILKSNTSINLQGWTSNANEAIYAANLNLIDMLIISATADGIEGLEASRILREQNKTIKIILTSKKYDPAFSVIALNFCLDSYISCDISEPEIANLISAVTAGRRSFGVLG